jgi:type II secretory ATPase GspE/PulE/Tfp pilus assembly ATPase PilB-like protein
MIPNPTNPGASLTLAEALMLMSPYKPVLYLLPFWGWAWVVSTIYDKDAARWYLPRRMWNLVHIAFAVAALGVVALVPVSFWITWPIMIGLLGADLAIYAVARNGDARVPENMKWSFNIGKMLAARAETKAAKAKKGGTSAMVFKGPGGELPVPPKESPEFELRLALEQLIGRMIDLRAVQMDLAPIKPNVYGAVYMVDGVRTQPEAIPQARAVALIDTLKGVAKLDVADRRRRLQGDIQLGMTGGNTIPARITTAGTSGGMKLSVLLDPAKQVTIKYDDLGLLPNQKEDMQTILSGKGVVLVTAPPDNGRTTLLYALTKKHDAYTQNVQTIETDIQASIEGVRQNLFDAQAEAAEFATTLRSILRRDPDVVTVCEVPDDATCAEAAKADSERTRIYLGMKADNPLLAVQIYAKGVGKQETAAKTLSGLIGVKLVRRLCSNCKVPFQPKPEDLKKLGLPADTKQLHRKGGQVMVKDKPEVCPVCGGTGYFGQVGIFSVHPLGADEKKLIAAGEVSALRAMLRQKKQQSLQSSGLQQVIMGNTSVEEVLRVTAEQAPSEAKKPAEAAAE